MKTKLKFIILIATVILLVVFGLYFVNTYKKINGRSVDVEQIKNTQYVSQYGEVQLVFDDSLNVNVFKNNKNTAYEFGEYADNLLIVTSEVDTLTFVVVDKNTLFSADFDCFLYCIYRGEGL